MNGSSQHYRPFLILLVAVSVAFAWILWPLYGAVFWGAILAILFAPIHRRIAAKLGSRRNVAASISLLVVLIVVIVPVIFIAGSLVQEGANLYERVKSGNLNFGSYVQQILDAMPASVQSMLARFGVSDLSSLQDRLTEGAMQASQFLATQAVNIGQNTAEFIVSFGVMLYLLFFLLRDGSIVAARVREAIPLNDGHKMLLLRKFTTVIRATVKGNIAVAAAQGALGGVIFYVLGIQGPVLWGVVMAFLSLLPAIGAGLVWGPVAVYFLVSGATWQGIALALYGVLVIGMVDNVLRPVLVGKDTKLPDYVVLISTLGGMGLFGLNGFVIGPLVAALFFSCWDLYTSDFATVPSKRKRGRRLSPNPSRGPREANPGGLQESAAPVNVYEPERGAATTGHSMAAQVAESVSSRARGRGQRGAGR
ncbi:MULTISPECIES: AI-2E family transporter [unclassified Bordetella]|uniref:AI-2E family transporter n=1 Tax=unclassified Bordetella TaxID=2630031 RepID=UPI0013237106|nr:MULTISPECIES: AI-2E family transporter [unclassified Bordetella]MVW71059.1 AI-2E family transporter [Bordetella sp. 15P40C-2]MVW80628.1 AI-2E family transporter [Bordetella sp. 02P26C-1]